MNVNAIRLTLTGLFLAGVTPASALDDVGFRPRPCAPVLTVVVYCEDGSRARWDAKECRFRCDQKQKPWVDPIPRPWNEEDSPFQKNFQSLQNGVGDLKDAVGSGNTSGASKQLGSFYSGANSLGAVSGSAGAVKTPQWKTEMSNAFLKEARRIDDKKDTSKEPPAPTLTDKDSSTIVLANAAVRKGIRKAIAAAEAALEIKRLEAERKQREGERAAREGKEKQRAAEKKWEGKARNYSN